MKNEFVGKLRPHAQEMPKHAAKVFINHTALAESGISPGKMCYVESTNGYGRRRYAVAWPSLDKSVGRNVALLSRVLQDLTGFPVGDVIRVSDAGDCPTAETVRVRETTPDGKPLSPEEQANLSAEERAHWEYLVEARLLVSEHVFGSLPLQDIRGKETRSFFVESVNDSKTTLAKVTKATKVQWINDEEAQEIDEAPKNFTLGSLPCLGPQINKLQWFLSRFGIAIEDGDFAPGFVIQGGEGTGKTMLLNHIANSHWGNVIRIKTSDKPEAVKGHFADAISRQRNTVLLIDDIGSLIGNEKSAFGIAMIETLVESFQALVDKATERGKCHVAVVMTCRQYLVTVPPALQSPDYIYDLVDTRVPNADERKAILRYYNLEFPEGHQEEFISKLGDETHAYTGSDLHKLIRRAKRNLKIQKQDHAATGPLEWEFIKEALNEVPPSAMHDICLKPPKVLWDDIAGNEGAKKNLKLALWRPLPGQKIRHKPLRGILLYGPPGCSKTMTAQALATECSLNFFSIKGGEILNKYVGETERTIRSLFQRARAASPSIVFFDEIDAIAGSREDSSASSFANVAIAALLSELDGFESREDVFIMAATNRPSHIDPALLRPGRFDKLVHIPMPDEAARRAIIEKKATAYNLIDIDADELARIADGLSGAEIAGVCNEAFSDYDVFEDQPVSDMEVLRNAFQKARRGVSPVMIKSLEDFEANRECFA